MAANESSKGEKLGFTAYLGTTLMWFADSFASGLMTSWFMTYLTDYAGIGALGAALGTGLLLFARLFDAVNDPFEGWLMDKAKPGKRGKYVPFIMLSIVCEIVGVSFMFFLPSGLSSSPVAVCVWVLFGYLVYDIGASFFAPNLVYRSMTLDSGQRSKLMIAPRMLSMILGMVTGALMTIVNSVNAGFNDLHAAFGVTVVTIMAVSGVVSLGGALLIKERYHSEPSSDERVKLTDIFQLFRENKPLRVTFLTNLFTGFVWTFLFATCMYYIKWGFCADLSTGAVDQELFATYSLIASMMMLFPLLLGTALAMPYMKLMKTPMRANRFIFLLEAIPCGVMFVLQLAGLLRSMPIVFFVCMAVCSTAIGMGFIPGETIKIQNMDYEIYKNGKDRSALCNAATKFLDKAQTAISSSVVGMILIAVGYVVDSTTGEYVGELAALPGMLDWFIVVMGLVPCVLALIGFFIFRTYPITPEVEAQMKAELEKKNA